MSKLSFDQLCDSANSSKILSKIIENYMKNGLSQKQAEASVAKDYNFVTFYQLEKQLNAKSRQIQQGKELLYCISLINKCIKKSRYLAKHQRASKVVNLLNLNLKGCYNLKTEVQNFLLDLFPYLDVYDYLNSNSTQENHYIHSVIQRWNNYINIRLNKTMGEQVVELVKYKKNKRLITSVGDLMDHKSLMHSYVRYSNSSKKFSISEFWSCNSKVDYEERSKQLNIDNFVSANFYVIENVFNDIDSDLKDIKEVKLIFECLNGEEFYTNVFFTFINFKKSAQQTHFKSRRFSYESRHFGIKRPNINNLLVL